jgi:osmoprotectant transport system permease protein
VLEYLSKQWDRLLQDAIEHIEVTAVSVAIAAVLGVAIAVLVHRSAAASGLAIGLAAAFLTIPSFALLGLLIPPFGLGWTPTVIALVGYSLLPILRNTIVGLRELPAGVLESARGMGMKPAAIMWRVSLPMAWPVILTGIRVSAQLALGIAAIAAYVSGPGLGSEIFSGLSRIGSKNALNQAVAGTVGVILLAFLFDAAIVGLRRLTTSRGLRA